MAKKTFVVYYDRYEYCEGMSDKQKANLFECIRTYAGGTSGIQPLPEIQFVRNKIKRTLDGHHKEYEVICKRNKENADKRRKNHVSTTKVPDVPVASSGYQSMLDTDTDIKKDIYIDQFEKLRLLYPKKTGKPKAREKYLKHKPGYKLVEKKIKDYIAFVEQERKNGFDRKYQDGKTRFNKGWEDEYDIGTILDQWKTLCQDMYNLGSGAQGHPVLDKIRQLEPLVIKETGRTQVELKEARKRKHFIF